METFLISQSVPIRNSPKTTKTFCKFQPKREFLLPWEYFSPMQRYCCASRHPSAIPSQNHPRDSPVTSPPAAAVPVPMNVHVMIGAKNRGKLVDLYGISSCSCCPGRGPGPREQRWRPMLLLLLPRHRGQLKGFCVTNSSPEEIPAHVNAHVMIGAKNRGKLVDSYGISSCSYLPMQRPQVDRRWHHLFFA